ncbi:MAG: hypothetical protein JRH19_26495 [Deltaproteobacteria bacterium]|nr:hypothetical protein [Deltaproteobacteria bacterium]
MPTDAAQRALAILRDGSQFQWYVIPLLALVLYVYAVEVERRRWDIVMAGVAFWGMDWFNEIWNGLVFHFTQYAPMWGAPADTAYLILIGLNIEISLMFAIAGVVFSKTLPRDKGMRILGVPNRLVIAAGGSAFCVIVELWLNAIGALTWDWAWWSARSPIPIFLFGYLHFFLVAFWVHDMESMRRRVTVVGSIYAFNLVCILVFGVWLSWI